MAAPHIPHSTDRNESLDHETATGNASTVKRIALVAALAACALVTLSIQDNTASVRPAPALPAAVAAADSESQEEAALAPSVTEYYLPGQYGNRTGAGGGNVTDREHARPEPSATDYYFPALHTNQATSNDGNVMTYEHD